MGTRLDRTDGACLWSEGREKPAYLVFGERGWGWLSLPAPEDHAGKAGSGQEGGVDFSPSSECGYFDEPKLVV